MCSEILLGVCTPYRSDNIYDQNQGIEYTWSFGGYGLNIISKDIDERYGKLSNLKIYYEDKLVYDKKKSVYIPGVWEEVLNELYKKLPVLVKKKEDREKRQQHCQEIVDKLIIPITYETRQEIQPYLKSLEVIEYTKMSSRINNCGSFVDDYYFEVKEKGETVFKAVSERMFGSDCDILVYEPGFWEYELDYLYKKYQKIKEREKEEKGKEYIKQIRDIK